MWSSETPTRRRSIGGFEEHRPIHGPTGKAADTALVEGLLDLRGADQERLIEPGIPPTIRLHPTAFLIYMCLISGWRHDACQISIMFRWRLREPV